MSNVNLPPVNCDWWAPRDSTPNPPEDNEFLCRLAGQGYKTFISRGGLVGSIAGNRSIDVIHRGFGRRWHIGFIQDNEEVYSEIVTLLPSHVSAAVAWLENEPLEQVKQLLHQVSDKSDK